jgi:4-amino-4-deoxy-L-arabinose transferase-like glycosyltransferase
MAQPQEQPRRRGMSRRGVTAILILVAALVIRIGYVETHSYRALNDAGTYNRMASMVAQYGDYHTGSAPKSGAGGSRGPTAYFPPGFPYFLAITDLLDGHEAGGRTAVAPERLEMAVTGTIAVGLIGLIGLEAFGAAPALVAMGLAAVYPVMIELSGTLVAENLVVVLELAAAWALLRARRALTRRRTVGWAAVCGLLTGLAALTHENAILYLLPFAGGAWLMWDRRAGPSGLRGRLQALIAPLAMVAACAAIIAPWTVRNAVELHHFVPIADETGITLAGTYNPTSARTPQIPYKWHLFSHVPSLHYLAPLSNGMTEVQLSGRLQTRALDYIRAHPTAPLIVSWDNTRRMFELEGSAAWRASARALSLYPGVAQIGVYALWLVCLLAIGGLFTPLARKGPWWLWAMPLLWWISTVPINEETPRFREPIDAFLVLLAACLLTTLADRARLGLGGPPVGRRRRPSQLAVNEAQLVEMVQGQP